MAINLPQKPRNGFHSISEIVRCLNGLIDYISSFVITGEKPIQVSRTMFQTKIGIDLDLLDLSSASGKIKIWNASENDFIAGQPVAFKKNESMHGDAIPAVFVTDKKKPWGVCVDQLSPGQIGDCIITGPAVVNLSGGSGDYAEPVVNGTGFKRNVTGTARVLFTGDKSIIILSGISKVGHPFDAEMINKGTEENPRYYVRIYNSALPDSPYAGVLTVYEWDMSVPVTEIEVTTQNGFFIVLDITYEEGEPPFSIQFSLSPHGSGSEVGYLTAREYIAEGKIPNVESRISGDIYVYGRWA